MIDKFKTIDGFDVQKSFDFSKYFTPEKMKSTCLLYCVWSKPQYLKFLYISLVSQFHLSDANKVDIYCFVDSELYDTAVEYLNGTPVQVVKIEDEWNLYKPTKYSILDQPVLQKYDKICLCDCDTFLMGSKFPLYHVLSQSPQPVLTMEIPDHPVETMLYRRELSDIKDADQYLQVVSDILMMPPVDALHMINQNKWFLSCFFAFNRTCFTGREWNDHVLRFQEIGSTCDETVFLTYAWMNQIPVANIDSIGIKHITSHRMSEIGHFKDTLLMTHPVGGTFAHDMNLQKIYHQILNVV